MKNFTRNPLKDLITSARIFTLAFVALSSVAFGQNYTSTANGAWTTGANWGGTAPVTAGQTWGTINVNHNMTISGNYDFQGGAVNVAAGKTLNITGNYTTSNGAKLNVSGNLNITGNVTLDSDLNILPGGIVTVDGSVTVKNSTYLNVGTNVNPTPYADLIIKQNLISQNSGDMILEKNSRVAIFGNFTSTDGSGGTKMTIKSGAQIYINGNINFTGGNDDIVNNNPTSPSVIGFYVNGTVSGSGGGSDIDSNRGNKATMQTNDPGLYTWVSGLSGSPLPITLISFKVSSLENTISLTWATASEKNFDKFIIERSADASTFEAIAEVKGAGNSVNTLHYNYADHLPLSGKNYYRLKSVDFDGSFEYSKVILAEYAGAKDFTIYPNPSNGESINYQASFEPQAGDQVIVIDGLGVQVATASIEQASGAITFNNTLKSGSYIVKYISNHYKKVERLVIK
jgi:hypothetical protein